MVFIVVSDNVNEEFITNQKIIFLESPCNIKDIDDLENYLIIGKNIIIKEDGYFRNLLDEDSLINQLSIDELLIMVNIKLIIMKNYFEKVEEISNFYKINYIILK